MELTPPKVRLVETISTKDTHSKVGDSGKLTQGEYLMGTLRIAKIDLRKIRHMRNKWNKVKLRAAKTINSNISYWLKIGREIKYSWQNLDL